MAHNIEHLEDYLAEIIADNLIEGCGCDEIEINGICFVFNCNAKTNYETAYTGVEHMGARETFSRPVIEATIKYEGAYDFDGEEITEEVPFNMADVLYYLNNGIDPGVAHITARAA